MHSASHLQYKMSFSEGHLPRNLPEDINNQKAGWAWSAALFWFSLHTMLPCFSLQTANKANWLLQSCHEMHQCFVPVCLPQNEHAGKPASVSISVSKIIVAGRKKKKTNTTNTHKNLVRKHDLTFTGHAAVWRLGCASVVRVLRITCSRAEEVICGICGFFPDSPGEICDINVCTRQLKVITQGLQGAAMHIICDWGPQLSSVRNKLHAAVWSSRTPMNSMSNSAKAYIDCLTSSIHSIESFFAYCLTSKEQQQIPPKILFMI